MNKNYEIISQVYSHMMEDIDYEQWALYIYDIICGLENKPNSFLELAAGNCKFAEAFTKFNKNIIATDLSLDMLKMHLGDNLTRVACNMVSLPFKNKFDAVISTFDSINYLLTLQELHKLFKGVNDLLNTGGYFIFDVSLENNSFNNVQELNRSGEVNGIKYIQKSEYDKKTKIHYNKFKIKMSTGEVFSEIHSQKVYDFYEYFEVAEQNGFFVKDCFECFSYDDATPDVERAQFVMRKK